MPIYVGPSGPSPSRFAVVGEAPGDNEEREGKPFVGAAGWELTNELREAGIPRTECFITNVSRFRPPNNQIGYFVTDKKNWAITRGMKQFRGMWVAEHIPGHIERLEFELRQTNPNVIMALGNVALWALTGEWGISKWRGSEMPTRFLKREDGTPFKVIPTYHPASIFRAYDNRFFAVQDYRKVLRESLTPEIYINPWNFLLRPSFKQAVDLLRSILDRLDAGPRRIVVDLETRRKLYIRCIGLGLSKYDAACFPLETRRTGRLDSYWSTLEEEFTIISLLKAVLTHPNARVCNQNIIYDDQFLACWFGFVANVASDTMIVHHTCFAELEKRLDLQASLYCEHYRFWKEDVRNWSDGTNDEELWSYNCEDCARTFECMDKLDNIVQKMGKQSQVDFEMALYKPIRRMVLKGVKVDLARRLEFSQELKRAMTDREEYFKSVLGHPLNPRSTAKNGQMQKLFYGDLGLKPILNEKTGNLTLDEHALEEIGRREPILRPLIKTIDEYRSIGVFRSNFVEAGLDKYARMHTTFNIAGANTYRFSSSQDSFDCGTNMQTIPKGTDSELAYYCKVKGPTPVWKLVEEFKKEPKDLWKDLDKLEDAANIIIAGQGDQAVVHYRFALPNVRRMFIPDEGKICMDWDLERADLQVVVWESGEQELKQMLREGVDFHSENAKTLNISRRVAKEFVHATNYVVSPRTAAKKFGITVHAADTLQKRWFGRYPGIKRWHLRVEQNLQTTRSVRNIFGFERFFFGRVEQLLPEAVAWGPQSTVAIIINTGLLNLTHNLPEVELLLQVHDSLFTQCDRSSFPAITPRIRKELLITAPYEDPLVIPVGCKWSCVSWGDAKPLEMGSDI